MAFNFLDTVKNHLMQNFAPENTQTNSSGVNPLQQYAGSLPPPPNLPSSPTQGGPAPVSAPTAQQGPVMPPQGNPTSLQGMIPPQPQPQVGIPAPMGPTPIANPITTNPGGITLNELLQLGVNDYLIKLLQLQGGGGVNG